MPSRSRRCNLPADKAGVDAATPPNQPLPEQMSAGYDADMDATPLLSRLMQALYAARLEVVLIGNAAAALHGAPVTTLDFDFMFRATPTNLRKLKAVAALLEAVILRPYYPVSNRYRMVDDATGLQADFMPAIHGVRSFEELRSRAVDRSAQGVPLLVASLADIIASKQAAGRDRDLAVLPVLEKTLRAVQAADEKPRLPRRPKRPPPSDRSR